MSNLNDFIGGTSLNFWRSEGFNNISTHGPYDGATGSDVVYGPNLEILGTTSDTHHFGKEFKLHHVPDRRVFAKYGYGKVDKYGFLLTPFRGVEHMVKNDGKSVVNRIAL